MTTVRITDLSAAVLEKAREAVREGLEGVGREACRAAAERLDRAGRVRTGRLRGSLGYAVDEEGAALAVGTDVPYAVCHELGTDTISPVHFLRDSLAGNVPEISETLEACLRGRAEAERGYKQYQQKKQEE